MVAAASRLHSHFSAPEACKCGAFPLHIEEVFRDGLPAKRLRMCQPCWRAFQKNVVDGGVDAAVKTYQLTRKRDRRA